MTSTKRTAGKGRKERGPRLLTEAELELMGILWKCGPCTVHEVQARLPAGRKRAYTSVSTLLRILETKEFVASRKEGRGHAYFATVGKEIYESQSLGHLLAKVFDEEPSSLVRRLLDTESLEADELREIRAMLDEKLRDA
jgi:predicted transcriptional regulator